MESFWGAPIQNISAKLFSIKDEFEGPELILPGGYRDILDQWVSSLIVNKLTCMILFSLQISYTFYSIMAYSYASYLTFSIIEGDDGEPALDIHLGQEVTTIEIDDITEQAVISTSSGDTFLADSVIITVPLGILKQGNIIFSPALPQEKINSIESLGTYSMLRW